MSVALTKADARTIKRSLPKTLPANACDDLIEAASDYVRGLEFDTAGLSAFGGRWLEDLERNVHRILTQLRGNTSSAKHRFLQDSVRGRLISLRIAALPLPVVRDIGDPTEPEPLPDSGFDALLEGLEELKTVASKGFTSQLALRHRPLVTLAVAWRQYTGRVPSTGRGSSFLRYVGAVGEIAAGHTAVRHFASDKAMSAALKTVKENGGSFAHFLFSHPSRKR